jgi:hypothetical protein
MKNKKNIYKPEVPATSAKTPALKYILIVVLLIAAAGIWWWQSNSKISENATAVNSDSVMTNGATGNINEPDMVTVQGGRPVLRSFRRWSRTGRRWGGRPLWGGRGGVGRGDLAFHEYESVLAV